jgi:hypothetical protein
MLSQLFSWEFLALFPFVFVSASYVSEIESSFQLYLMNITGYHYHDYEFDYVDLKNIVYPLPYLVLTVYLGTLFLMSLIPRLQLGKKHCQGFVSLYFLCMVTACTLFGCFFAWSCCVVHEAFAVPTAPYWVTIFFVAILQDLTDKHVQTTALSVCGNDYTRAYKNNAAMLDFT